MNYLIYISTSVTLFSNEDLAELLLLSRDNNGKDDITGMLLYNNGTFLQVLEGEEGKLNMAFEKIKKDPRHKGIIKMKSGTLAERNFPEWSMGFTITVPDSYSALPGFVNPANKRFLQGCNVHHPAVNLLRSFAMNNNFVY